MKQQLKQQQDAPSNLNSHDAAQGVTTNPQDAGSGGNAPIGGHGQDSRTWTQGGVSHGNPATLAERETRSKHADGGAAEEQGEVATEKPATDANDSVAPPAAKKHAHQRPM